MAERLTIYAGPPVAAALEGIDPGSPGRGGDASSRSGRINAICERYLAVVERERPTLRRGEWLLLCDVLSSSVRDPVLIDGLALEVEDSAGDGMGEKWGVDVGDLAQRIGGMTFGQRMAAVEVVERFWRAEGDYDECLGKAGALIRAD